MPEERLECWWLRHSGGRCWWQRNCPSRAQARRQGKRQTLEGVLPLGPFSSCDNSPDGSTRTITWSLKVFSSACGPKRAVTQLGWSHRQLDCLRRCQRLTAWHHPGETPREVPGHSQLKLSEYKPRFPPPLDGSSLESSLCPSVWTLEAADIKIATTNHPPVVELFWVN